MQYMNYILCLKYQTLCLQLYRRAVTKNNTSFFCYNPVLDLISYAAFCLINEPIRALQ